MVFDYQLLHALILQTTNTFFNSTAQNDLPYLLISITMKYSGLSRLRAILSKK